MRYRFPFPIVSTAIGLTPGTMSKMASLVRGHTNPFLFKDPSSHHLGQGAISVNRTTDKSARVSLGDDLH